MNLRLYFLLASTLMAPFCAMAQQQPTGSPVDHIDQISGMDREMQKKYISYMSAVAHSSPRKMEKRRQELLATIQESIQHVGRVRPYKGDASLRDTYSAFLKILLTVFREDYHKIVDMEEIAEQSYDNMEAYLLAQERAGEKLRQAAEKIEPAYMLFATKHNVRLVEPEKESKTSRKLEMIGKVNGYYHKVYLVFFKSNHQESYLVKAMSNNDLNAVEQSKNSLLSYATEGLSKLDTTKAFQGDLSLVTACRKVLEFHKMEAEQKIPVITEYLLKNDEFQKIKKAMDAKSDRQRTQADVDKYNEAVSAMNASIVKYSKTVQELNAQRKKLIDNWNSSARKFMDTHMPTDR